MSRHSHQIGMLTGMTAGINLGSNQIAGSIPSQMGMLSAMTANLDLGGNVITGPVPSELGQLSGFTSNFNIGSNALTGTLPAEFADAMVGVTGFDIGGNTGMTGCRPDGVEVGSDGGYFPTPCPAYYGLTALYKSADGPHWSNSYNNNWMNGDPCDGTGCKNSDGTFCVSPCICSSWYARWELSVEI